MTSGAARLMVHQLSALPADHPLNEVYNRIIAREGNWISSQWMTERPGGSDVQNSETYARRSPIEVESSKGTGILDNGDWLISGYKFFCSATDCDIALMLAKTESGHLSLFLAPTKRTVVNADGCHDRVTNGIRFHRLKNKMGTKELPTAELELTNVRAHLVGPMDRGIATIATLLNVTRTHNFITALSCWRRGMAIAENFARARTTIDQPLWTFPMHLRLLGDMETKFQGLLQLAYFTTSLLSFADNGFPAYRPRGYAPLPEPGEQTKVVQRALTAAAKAVICKVACTSLQECQEAMGGVGYMDEPDEPEHNISRLYRDTAANMTWEGTTNVLASEVVRHLLNGCNLEVFGAWMENAVVANIVDEELREALATSWHTLMHKLEEGREDLSLALADGRQLMFSLAWVVCAALLAHDAQRDGNAEAAEVARRWVLYGEGGVGEHALADVTKASAMKGKKDGWSSRHRRNWDCRLVWGFDLPKDASKGYRLPKTTSSGRPEQVVAQH
jgi:alkylation response protein AidB-like acyl-CoA dehydrogenase